MNVSTEQEPSYKNTRVTRLRWQNISDYATFSYFLCFFVAVAESRGRLIRVSALVSRAISIVSQERRARVIQMWFAQLSAST